MNRRLSKISILLIFIFILSLNLMGCGNETAKDSKETTKEIKVENKKEENNKKTAEITKGELYDKINSIEKVKGISTIEDTEVGFINLNIGINVTKGTAMEELDSYTKKAANIQTNLENYFIEKKFVRIAYVMYVDNEMKSVVVTYKKEDGKYILENTSIVDEKYKKAADALK
ncbi:hypothetical protein FDF29_06575 [Clostridium botulinum]|uniref:Puattive membrane protein n=1 Tax=Clostridium botulinum (strain Hall / ATCC 3502 / NCTC 13319 / Type A) TaxID=441771 RepID=A5I4A8_CLOBH|nr:puattive membrane protein [Clostridium botulinum]NFL68477.1 hypothetical protein [Clostridium botulinum]NFQ52971.1 hypothetical protein [Clostridium botulinum]NFT45915.1 hypothetical protein [Clostridium botulinum]QGT41853.1 hypothetical protein GJ703_00030 [Clostridium botulinum]CAL83880.1 puattive membrane protein [Clostridium botulinum A str. ATCC 3502]